MKILGYNWTGLRIRRQIMLVILSEFEETESISILPEIIRKPMLINDPPFFTCWNVTIDSSCFYQFYVFIEFWNKCKRSQFFFSQITWLRLGSKKILEKVKSPHSGLIQLTTESP